jgi:hypothetical protein
MHDKGEEVGTTPYIVINIHTSPTVYMGRWAEVEAA